MITARAYTQLGGFEKALAELDGINGEAADQVRADIMWQNPRLGERR